MEWQEVCVKTETEAVEAIAEVFNQIGAGGAIIEDQDTHKLTYVLIKGYLPFDEEFTDKLDLLKIEINEIAARLGKEPYEIGHIVVNDEDWANSWKKYFKPLKIGKRIVIRPTWEVYTPDKEEIVLDMDPGMAFGTGSHATTNLCVRFLEEYVKPGMTVVDIGTGTGILGMCAARLGATKVLALDNDPVAVRVATENILMNELDGIVEAARHNLLAGVSVKADLLVSNIVADIILVLLPQSLRCLSKNGIFIVSGIIDERKEEVIEAAIRLGYRLIEEKQEAGWTALVCQLKE